MILKKIDTVQEEWRYVPVIVSTNVERQGPNFDQAKRFAKEHGTCVVWWNAPLPESLVELCPRCLLHVEVGCDNMDSLFELYAGPLEYRLFSVRAER